MSAPTATVTSPDRAWIEAVSEIASYRPGGWVYVATPQGGFYAHREEITVHPPGTRRA